MTRYAIIGNGPCGLIAAETIRKHDANANIDLFGAEPGPCYSRMALPYWISGMIDEDGCNLRKDAQHFAQNEIHCQSEHVTAIDIDQKRVMTDKNAYKSFDKLLIATGSRANTPLFLEGINDPRIGCCWTKKDAQRLINATPKGAHVVLLGAGFIACTLLPALLARKLKVTILESEQRMLPRMMDEKGAQLLKRWCESKGMNIICNANLKEVTTGKRLTLHLEDQSQSLKCDYLLLATGVKPNIEIASKAGLEVDQGIVVDHYLQTSHKDIFAAGDCAQGPSLLNPQHKQISAIQPTASDHGRIAGLNLCARKSRYSGFLDMNVLNTAGLISNSFGLWDGINAQSAAEHYRPESYQYLRLNFSQDRIIGAITIGMTQHIGVIRGLISAQTHLGKWARKLKNQPQLVMDAWLDIHQPQRFAAIDS